MLDPYIQVKVSVNWLFHICMYFNIFSVSHIHDILRLIM